MTTPIGNLDAVTDDEALAAPEPSEPTPRPEFDSSEHLLIGDGVVLHLDAFGDGVFAKDAPLRLSDSLTLTYGQVVYLGGDFFGSADEDSPLPPSIKSYAPISDGATLAVRQHRFNRSYDSLFLPNMAGQIAAIKIIVEQREGPTFSNAVYEGAIPSKYFEKNFTDWVNIRFNDITEGRYAALLVRNWDHFGDHAVSAYIAGHSLAILDAVAARRLPRHEQPAALMRAYAKNAFADHYLTDLFSSGHLRTPRKMLHDNSTPMELGDLLSSYSHDEDSRVGLNVSNGSGLRWRCYGDARYNDNVAMENRLLVGAAVQTSVDEVYRAFLTGRVPPAQGSSYRALAWLVPIVRPGADPIENFSVLFKTDYGMRTDINNLADSSHYIPAAAVTAWTRLKTEYRFPTLAAVPATPTTAPWLVELARGGGAAAPDFVEGNAVRYTVSFLTRSTDVNHYLYESDFGPWSAFGAITAGRYVSELANVPQSAGCDTVLYRQFQFADGKRSRVQCIGKSDGSPATTDNEPVSHEWDCAVYGWCNDDQAWDSVTVGADGSVFMCALNGVFRYSGQRRVAPLDGAATQISAGDVNSIWGVKDGKVSARTLATSWQQVASPTGATMTSVSVATAQLIFGVDTQGRIWSRAGVAGNWRPYPAHFRAAHVVCAPDSIAPSALDTQGNVWMWSGTTNWVQLPTKSPVRSIAAAPFKMLWLVYRDGSVDSMNLATRRARRRAQGGFAKVAVGNSSDVWGISNTGTLWRLCGPDYRYALVPLTPVH